MYHNQTLISNFRSLKKNVSEIIKVTNYFKLQVVHVNIGMLFHLTHIKSTVAGVERDVKIEGVAFT